MALTTSGLPNNGITAHYAFEYDDSLAAPGGPEPARTIAVMAACEGDFSLMSSWFLSIALDVQLPMSVQVVDGIGGAAWQRIGTKLTVTIMTGDGSATVVRYLLVSEIVEQFMRKQHLGWYGSGTEGSAGEGLSRFLAAQFLAINGLGHPPLGSRNSNVWLNSARLDYVNTIAPTDDGPDEKTGCALLFIYYLFSQLGFSIISIVDAGAPTLAGVYRKLTTDPGDPFPFFKQLVESAFPGTSTITTGNIDNPFPLGILSFALDKSTFGRDEVTDAIGSASNGNFPNAFWLFLEGFNIQAFSSLTLGTPVLSGPFHDLPQLSLAQNGSGVQFETPANNRIPQRIRFPFDVGFTNATLSAFPGPGANPIEEVLRATIDFGGNPLPGAVAETEFELSAGADPYFTNIDPEQNNGFWLSQDLRVFTALPGENRKPVAGGPDFGSDSVGGAYAYVQSLLDFLNDPSNNFTDGTNDPFTSGAILAQARALSDISSVSALTIKASFPPAVFKHYSFAIARVRMRGAAGPAGQAQNVKVFFRLWSTQTADTGFDPSSTYLSHNPGTPQWPQPATDNHTIPFFATGNDPDLGDPGNPEYGTNGINNRTIAVQSGDTVWTYFGCFLNFFDPANVVNGTPVQALLVGTHHCLVAEIAYDGAPIINANGITATPENSDKLAQRNLQVTFSDNPGAEATHRIPQTFDLRPGQAVAATPGDLFDYPDELMIDWGQTPVGSIAHIYWPAVSAFQVLELANKRYGTHLLSASDGNTIDCTVTRGVTYVPVPSGTAANIAGLFTVDLPTIVTVGQEFNIIVRRLSTRRPETVIFRQPRHGRAKHAAASTERVMTNWRYVTGTFQIKIPVTSRETMLRPDEDALAIMTWRLQQMAPANRWYPVVRRYISYLSARVDGLGGDSGAVPPSPTGAPVKDDSDQALIAYTGRVIEVLYDCFGGFEGFALGECCDRLRAFKSREHGIGKVALRACKERLLVTVFLERGRDDCIRKLVIRP